MNWEDGLRLRVYLGESDRIGGHAASQVIVDTAREAGLGGATVFRGVAGYGEHAELHTARVLSLSSDLPIVVEIVDRKSAVESFLPRLEGLLEGGMVALDPVRMRVVARLR